MRLSIFVFPLLAAACATGCLEIQGPLDAKPTMPPDPRIGGTWRCLPGSPAPDAAPATLDVQLAADDTYAVRFQEDGDKPEFYRAWASESPAGTLLNVASSPATDGPFEWVLVRYGLLRPDVLTVEVVSARDLANSKVTTEEARKVLDERKADPALFETFSVCVKTKSP